MKTQSLKPNHSLVGAGLLSLLLIIGGLLVVPVVIAADLVVYKSPTCGCCAAWISHMEQNGHQVKVHDRNDLPTIKRQFGVPEHLQSCHTAMVEGYVIEGHVPAEDVERLLKERPAVNGLTVPGMPMGSPGMEGHRKDPYDVLTFKRNGNTDVFARR
ncbi:MAG: DUF411 domain-containing protein [Candidatus Thiodiazotropha sp. (ex Notomyrtea botanica)]|nr:DUF411 domain-containing protein [Candidatus Thiodiazotropha sp. (ex Notomyrtea botanica)]